MSTPHDRFKTRRKELLQEITVIEHDLDAPIPKDWEDRAAERSGDEVLFALGLYY